LYFNRSLCTNKTYSRAADKFYFFSLALEQPFSNFEKHIGAGDGIVEPLKKVTANGNKFSSGAYKVGGELQ
jgi:hypothetical protein